ncbi:MAG: hypothetical protein ACRYFS_10790 [Janthinobacterium lividum]
MMQFAHTPQVVFVIICGAVLGSLIIQGCGSKAQEDNAAPGSPQFEQQVKKVQDDPSLSPQLKASILSAMKRNPPARKNQ